MERRESARSWRYDRPSESVYDHRVVRGIVFVVTVASCGFHAGVAPTAGPVDGSVAIDAIDAMPLDAWSTKRRVTIENTGLGELTAFGFVIELDATRITYATASPVGADLRFTDVDGTPLPYEIESWDPSGTSFVWVGVATIAANTNTTLWMYYGNPAATDAQQPTLVWDSSYLGVWHLADAHDSTGKHVSSNQGATATTGMIGPAMMFTGSPQAIDTGAAEHLDTFTLEAWMRPSGAALISAPSGPV